MRPTALLVCLSGLALGASCAVNPATGQKELALVSESQEIQMGLSADPSMTVEEFARANPGPVPVATVALVNNVDPGDRFAAGSLAKRIVGDPLP